MLFSSVIGRLHYLISEFDCQADGSVARVWHSAEYTFGNVQISWTKKFNMIFLFFLLRKLILPFYSFTLFCIILPMTMFVPEATLPAWVVCYIPALMSFLNVIPSPKSFPFLVPFLLFENTMSVTKFNAMISGLFQLRSSQEWVVTKKSGSKALEGLDASASEAELLNKVEGVTSAPVVLGRGVSESGVEALKQKQAESAPAEAAPKKKTVCTVRSFHWLSCSWLLQQGVFFQRKESTSTSSSFKVSRFWWWGLISSESHMVDLHQVMHCRILLSQVHWACSLLHDVPAVFSNQLKTGVLWSFPILKPSVQKDILWWKLCTLKMIVLHV